MIKYKYDFVQEPVTPLGGTWSVPANQIIVLSAGVSAAVKQLAEM